MTDPFVQRILARTQARRNFLGKVGDSNKENSAIEDDQPVKNDMVKNVSHLRQRVTDLDKVNVVEIHDDKPKALRDSSNTASQSHSSTSLSPNKVSDSSLHTSSKNLSSSRSQRFQHLAQRSKQMQEWDDDYTYHSVCGGLIKNVEVTGFGLHDSASASEIQHDLTNVTSKNVEKFTTKYYFGQLKNSTKNEGNNEFRASVQNSSYSNSSFTPENSSYSPIDPAKYKILPTSPSSFNSKNDISFLSSTVLPAYTPTQIRKAVSSSKSVTPTRRLNWDEQLLKSLIESSNNLQWELEAQGFTPSTSKSKLAYDFRERSPIKNGKVDEPSQPFEHLNSENSQVELNTSKEPKIISFISKSSFANNENGSQSNPDKSTVPQIRGRDTSPSKVSDLRGRWEEHIRKASPERQLQRVNSPSPTRKFNQKTLSVEGKQNTIQFTSDSNLKLKEKKWPLSPSKSCQPLESINREVPAVPVSNGFNRGFSSRTSLRSLSPHKPPPSGEVIKGENPMPEVEPVVKNPTASVKERAAAFASISNKVPEKDPAELSVRDRLSIFEKKKGSALIPKAPFGQCISDKTLQLSTSKPEVKSIPNGGSSFDPSKEDKKVRESNSAPTSQPNIESKGSEAKSFVGVHKKHFERLEDNWQETDINSKVMNERNHEMEMLRNRFRKPCSGYTSPPKSVLPLRTDESDSEYPESETSTFESEDSAPQDQSNVAQGPPKPPRVLVNQGSPTQEFACPRPPPFSHSPSKRLNSTEIYESCRNSPSKEFVPKIKPGCLFPSLSDIESHSEAQESDEENKDSSFAESVLTCASGESLGTKIQKMAQTPNLPLKQPLSVIQEDSEFKKPSGNQYELMSTSTMEALEAIDDAIDEAFDEDSVTPPKRGRYAEDEGSNSVYKTPKIHSSSDNTSSSSENSLAHTISMYRKQKPAEVYVTPVRQITRIPDLTSPSKDSPVSPSVTISSRIRELQEEEEHQLTVISQASSAISVVTQHPEQHGTTQHIEAEKLLLVATQKRQCALNEIQRLKAEGALGKRNYWSQDEDSSQGSISISNITLPLKQDYLGKLGDTGIHHFVVLVKHRDQVITSQLQTTPNCILEGAITFPNLMALHNLKADFNISLEVYGFRVEPLSNSGIKKEHSRLKLTPLKRLQKESKAYSPAMSSPGGPYSIRTSSFALIGFANLNINTLTRNAWTLEKVPYTSPIDGHLLMRVSVTMEGGVKESSFLTMFNDVGGFGAWNRRWCVLSGPFIKYWSYPEDETTKEAIGVLDLRMCTTRKIELVPRDICARQHTFQLTLVRPLRPGDKTDLVHEIKNNALISRILLSADSKEDRILWCNKLNKSLANIRAWDPDALKPEDFHV